MKRERERQDSHQPSASSYRISQQPAAILPARPAFRPDRAAKKLSTLSSLPTSTASQPLHLSILTHRPKKQKPVRSRATASQPLPQPPPPLRPGPCMIFRRVPATCCPLFRRNLHLALPSSPAAAASALVYRSSIHTTAPLVPPETMSGNAPAPATDRPSSPPPVFEASPVPAFDKDKFVSTAACLIIGERSSVFPRRSLPAIVAASLRLRCLIQVGNGESGS